MSSTSRLDNPPSKSVVAGAAALLALALLMAVVAIVWANQDPTGDPGRLTEPAVPLPNTIDLPVLVDATAQWGLADLALTYDGDQMAGGVAMADVNGDGTPELIVANGQVAVLQWTGAGFGDPVDLGAVEAIGVSSTDIDGDRFQDLLIGTAGDVDYIVWGGSWLDDQRPPERSPLPADGQSSGLLAGELSGDDLIDIVRLGRGAESAAPDVLWVATAPRQFEPQELPLPERATLAGELVDADADGLLDIWLTRDIGWARGGDTVLSRQGDPTGSWTDVAASLGVALEVDGMGITIADLDGDLQIDAYVSDLGDNEILMGTQDGFVPTSGRGAAHIRPNGAPDDVVSSTWGTGALDVNLDGVLDLVLGSGGFPVGQVRNKIDGTQVAIEESPALLLGHGDGTFTDVWPDLGLQLDIVARGLSVADLDRDGDDDVVIVDRRGTVHVLRNDTPGPSVAIGVSPACGNLAGYVLTVEASTGSYQRLLAPHGYASSHGAQIIVGTPDRVPVEIELVAPGHDPASNPDPLRTTVEAQASVRRSVELDCP